MPGYLTRYDIDHCSGERPEWTLLCTYSADHQYRFILARHAALYDDDDPENAASRAAKESVDQMAQSHLDTLQMWSINQPNSPRRKRIMVSSL